MDAGTDPFRRIDLLPKSTCLLRRTVAQVSLQGSEAGVLAHLQYPKPETRSVGRSRLVRNVAGTWFLRRRQMLDSIQWWYFREGQSPTQVFPIARLSSPC